MKCPACHSENPDTSQFCADCGTGLANPQEVPFSQTKTLQASSKVLAKGSMLAGKYRIIEPLGRGGMGVVYKAEDMKLKRNVALKFLPAEFTENPEARERFVREAQATAALSHPHICTIHEINEEGKESFIVMEYIEGQSLRQKISGKSFPQSDALDMAIQIAEGLAEAHKKGIVHRDIKPGNIMVTADGKAKVTDFGLAKVLGESLITKEAKTMGTAAYMSPEQVRGETLDHRTDIWSLGVVFYEMLTGKLPFRGDHEQSLMYAIVDKEPEQILKTQANISKELENVIQTALAKNPADRYQSIGELLEDLQAVAEGLKPLKAKPKRDKGRFLGIGKIYFYAGLAVVVVAFLFSFNVGGVRDILFGKSKGPTIRSIAVLPLANLSGDPAQEYLSDGMTDALIAGLAQIKAIKVISRTSAMQYKEARKPLPNIAKELGVEGIVEGSVMRSGNRVRITAQLIDARQDRHLWAGNYEREMTDVLALQSEVVRTIAGEIRAQVTPKERERLSTARTVDPQAYEAYLMGRLFLNKATVPAVEKSIGYFRQTIDRDPKNAAAYVGLVEAYAILGQMAALPLAEVALKERETALKAVEIDNTLAEGHVALGSVKVDVDWDWEGAEREYKRAINLNPNFANAYLWYSQLLNWLGRHEEAFAAIERARELDPLNPFIAANRLFRFYFLGQYDKAIAESQKLSEMYPDFWLNHWVRGFLYAAKGMHEQAIAEQRKAVALSEGSLECLPWLGYAYARAGRKSEALEVLGRLGEESKKRYVPSILSAPVYVGLGERDRAFESLERAYQEHDSRLVWLLVDPCFESLRSDPRFQDLRRRMKLPG